MCPALPGPAGLPAALQCVSATAPATPPLLTAEAAEPVCAAQRAHRGRAGSTAGLDHVLQVRIYVYVQREGGCRGPGAEPCAVRHAAPSHARRHPPCHRRPRRRRPDQPQGGTFLKLSLAPGGNTKAAADAVGHAMAGGLRGELRGRGRGRRRCLQGCAQRASCSPRTPPVPPSLNLLSILPCSTLSCRCPASPCHWQGLVWWDLDLYEPDIKPLQRLLVDTPLNGGAWL